jgi:DNA-binding NarL/FixJ family response regulator
MKDDNLIQVLIVDDHAMVRRGIRSILEDYPDIRVVGEASDGIEAILLVDQIIPCVVVMDINMPRMNGVQASRQILRRYPNTIIIGLSVNVGSENERAMKQAGALKLLPKEAAGEELYNAIREAVTNQ